VVVADALAADIESGRYPVGSLLPPEIDLAAQYGISRHTAREAMRRLEESGLISRRAGIGTTVKASSAQSHYRASISDLAELVHFTKQTQLKILSEEWVTVSGELAGILPEAIGQQWLRFTTLRYPTKGRVPISYTAIIVHPSHADIRQRIHEPNATVYRLIEELHGERIREVRQEISCVALPDAVARLLGAPAQAPARHVLRYYIGKGDRLLSVSINLYPQDRFRLSTRWRLDRGGDRPAPD
jgi:DNA-binding GntR family transcriptional regulator